ncbi:LysR family transcriptional regulator [Acuticoccus sp. M5D2P5]|uniref:LysR family transcriptional regulator n=1 Tax=Acuticoccus kalidii TaxID=2910977 RepID=UPI001F47D8A2|nr:LysR family transcriptional regulator [Acuticoccus kalidii]MCF3935712.1 LysR family transcriptional regulator [Acuticoccus kalidii]
MASPPRRSNPAIRTIHARLAERHPTPPRPRATCPTGTGAAPSCLVFANGTVMSIRALRSLLAIVQHGSFARAAHALGLTPSAVGLHVKALEEEFRARLFDRSRRRPVLTEAGEIAVNRAREVVDLYDSIGDEISRGPGVAGRLRVGAIQTALAESLPESLARLQRAHPRLRVRVRSGMSAELALEVEAGTLDVAVTTEPVKPYPSGLAFMPVYTDHFWAVAAPEHEGASLSDLLARLPFLRFDKRAWAGRLIEDELRRQGHRIGEEMELDSREALARMAANGLGVAILPLSPRGMERLPPLMRLPFGSPQLTRRVGLLIREGQSRSGGITPLFEAMKADEA